MSNSVGLINASARVFLLDGKIDKKEADALVAFAKAGDEQDKAAVKEIFQNDAFDKGVNKAAVLGAAGVKGKVDTHPAVGAKVGTGIEPATKKQVTSTVSAVVGDPKGYANENQALAAARLALVPGAAVMQKSGRYYAVQTTPALTNASAGNREVKPVDLKEYEKVRASALPSAEKYRKLAAMAYGVPEEHITVYDSTRGEQPNPANINVDLGLDASKMGNEGHTNCECHGRVNGKPGSISVSTHLLDRGPMRAATTLFHEGTHAADEAAANKIYNQLTQNGAKPLSNPLNAKDYARINAAIEKSGLQGAQKMAVSQLLGVGDGGTTKDKQHIEANAYAKSVIASAESDPEGLKSQLVGLLAELSSGRQPFTADSRTFKDLAQQLKDAYRKMPAHVQQQLVNGLSQPIERYAALKAQYDVATSSAERGALKGQMMALEKLKAAAEALLGAVRS